MFWMTLPTESLENDGFWKRLGTIFRYVQKGSGHMVFHMPRKSKAWKREGVKKALESFGLYKVSFELKREKTIVATNDAAIREYLNPHGYPGQRCKSCSS